MSNLKQLVLLVAGIVSTLSVIAGRPINGTTRFNTVSEGQKASGNAAAVGGINALDIEGFNFKLTTASAGPTIVIEVWDGTVSSLNGVALYELTSTVNPLLTAITITANDGALFDLNSIGINAQHSNGGSTTVTVTGLDASGNPVPGASITNLASESSLTVFNTSLLSAFKTVAGIRITSPNIVYAFIDDINLANVGTVLPLTGLDFSATAKNSSVLLNWSTQTEQSTSSFNIEHSVNGTAWTSIGNIAAAGNSNTAKSYSYNHPTPNNGSNYYRLAQQDINGRKTFSNIIYIDTRNKATQLAIYPTLATDGFVNVKLAKKTMVQVYNPGGAMVLSKTLPEGVSQLPVNSLPSGVYHLRADGQTETFVIL